VWCEVPTGSAAPVSARLGASGAAADMKSMGGQGRQQQSTQREPFTGPGRGRHLFTVAGGCCRSWLERPCSQCPTQGCVTRPAFPQRARTGAAGGRSGPAARGCWTGTRCPSSPGPAHRARPRKDMRGAARRAVQAAAPARLRGAAAVGHGRHGGLDDLQLLAGHLRAARASERPHLSGPAARRPCAPRRRAQRRGARPQGRQEAGPQHALRAGRRGQAAPARAPGARAGSAGAPEGVRVT